MSETKLYPAWKQAVVELVSEGLPPGRVIPDDRLCRAFGFEVDMTSVAAYQRTQLMFNQHVGDLCDALLRGHCVKLDRVQGGYVVVAPEDQAKRAMDTHARDAHRGFSKAMLEVTHIRHEALSISQRKDVADAQARLANIMAFTSKHLRLT